MKTCKSCKSEINEKAKKCPNCHTDQRNWLLRHPIISVLIFLIIAAFVVNPNGDKATQQQENNDNNAVVAEVDATPTEAPEPKVYEGTGDDVIDIEKPGDGPFIVAFECANCTGNTVLQTNGSEPLLVNEIGSYSGQHIVDTSTGANTSELTIKASGPWTVTVGGLNLATQSKGEEVSGTGDTVIHLTGSTTKAEISNIGESNFAVIAYPEDGIFPNLAVNTIGSYKGTVKLDAPAYIQVTSSGDWTLFPQ